MWSLPALVVGLVLRVVLSVQMPYAYFHDDTPDFLTTPHRLFEEGKFHLHGKKTFLVPLVFTVPFALPVPVLQTVPVLHHLIGLGLVMIVGALCRLWFRHWKLVIVPATLACAVNPFLLWYERTLMAETIYIFCTAALVLAGTLYAEARTPRRFIVLAVALVIEAGARPEGKLLFGFGLFLLLLVHWKDWALLRRRAAILVVLGIAVHFMTRTSQGGLLLYTSLARFTPTELKCAPGFDRYIAPIRETLNERWAIGPYFPRVRDRKDISAAVRDYLEEHPVMVRGKRITDVNDFCTMLAFETAARNWWRLPRHAWDKFAVVASENPAGLLDAYWVWDRQIRSVTGPIQRRGEGDSQVASVVALSKGLYGREMKAPEEFESFIRQHYEPVAWFHRAEAGWRGVWNAVRLPDRPYPHLEVPGIVHQQIGASWIFLLGMAGLVAAALSPGPLQRFHIAWGLAAICYLFVVMLTANVRPRFRIVFEPFWLVYLALLAETLWLGARRLLRR